MIWSPPNKSIRMHCYCLLGYGNLNMMKIGVNKEKEQLSTHLKRSLLRYFVCHFCWAHQILHLGKNANFSRFRRGKSNSTFLVHLVNKRKMKKKFCSRLNASANELLLIINAKITHTFNHIDFLSFSLIPKWQIIIRNQSSVLVYVYRIESRTIYGNVHVICIG